MIFGRPVNLILGAFTAVFNIVVLIAPSVANYTFTPELVAAVNLAAAAVIALVANQAPTVTAGSTVNVVTPAGEPNKTVTVA